MSSRRRGAPTTTRRRSDPSPSPAPRNVIRLLPGGGDRGLSHQPASPPGTGDAVRGNAHHPVCSPPPLPRFPPSPPCALSPEAHGTSFFYLLFPLLLVLRKNHFDAKATHITRSEAPLVVTPFPGILLHCSLPGLSRHQLASPGGRASVWCPVAPSCVAEEAAVPIGGRLRQHTPRSHASGADPLPSERAPGPLTLHPELPKLHIRPTGTARGRETFRPDSH